MSKEERADVNSSIKLVRSPSDKACTQDNSSFRVLDAINEVFFLSPHDSFAGRDVLRYSMQYKHLAVC